MGSSTMSCLCCWNRRPSSPGSSTSQRESFTGPGRPCQTATSLSSLREIKSYKAFSKIHKAASRGDVATVERRLILRKNDISDRDRNDRCLGLGVRGKGQAGRQEEKETCQLP